MLFSRSLITYAMVKWKTLVRETNGMFQVPSWLKENNRAILEELKNDKDFQVLETFYHIHGMCILDFSSTSHLDH